MDVVYKIKKIYKNMDNFESVIFGFNEYMFEWLYFLMEDIKCVEF